jgi:uncharacterized protein YjbI with pentapeptide repeats
MKPAEVKALRERWGPSSKGLAVAASRWLAGSGKLPREVGSIDGRVDLRGLPFADAIVIGEFAAGGLMFQSIAGMPQFTGVTWRGIDLSGSIIRHARFFNATVEDCRFDGADLFDWRLWNSQVQRCSFVRADLKGSALGTSSNSWADVAFDSADLRDAVFRESIIRNVSYRRANLRGASFEFGDLDGLVFEGLLDTTRFLAVGYQGKPQGTHWMRNVEFRDALFRNCQMQGYRMENVRLPRDVLLVPNFPDVVKRARSIAADADSSVRNLVSGLVELSEMTSEVCWDYVMFPSDLAARGFQEIGDAISTILERAMRETPPPPCD